MAIYKAVRDSFGYLGRYWKAGETVEAAELPNKHFISIKPDEDNSIKTIEKNAEETVKSKRKRRS